VALTALGQVSAGDFGFQSEESMVGEKSQEFRRKAFGCSWAPIGGEHCGGLYGVNFV